MHSIASAIVPRAAAGAAGAFALSLVFALGAARADDKTYVMKVTPPTLNDGPHPACQEFCRRRRARFRRPHQGRGLSGEPTRLDPAPDRRRAIRRHPGRVIPPEFFVGVDERFEVMAAPGLVDSLAHGQRLAADPAVLKAHARVWRRQRPARRRNVHRRAGHSTGKLNVYQQRVNCRARLGDEHPGSVQSFSAARPSMSLSTAGSAASRWPCSSESTIPGAVITSKRSSTPTKNSGGLMHT